MDGPRVMYTMKPIFKLPDKIELPTCMYHMRSINDPKVIRATCDSNEILDSIKDKRPLPELRALEKRWDGVLDELNDLVAQVKTIKEQLSSVSRTSSSQFTLDKKALEGLKGFEGAVINANPKKPPYSLFLIRKLCDNFVNFSSHVHSSVASIPEDLMNCCQSLNTQDLLKVSLIWKEGLLDSELVLNPVKQIPIRGEVNILRHLARMGLDFLQYPLDDAYQTIQIDSILDVCHRLQHTQAQKEVTALFRGLNAKLGRNSHFGGDKLNIGDIAAWSVLKQIAVKPSQDLTSNMAKWYNRMEELYLS